MSLNADKSCITGTFTISFDGNVFPVQLIYSDKIIQSLLRVEFSKDFSLSTDSKHFSMIKQKRILICPSDQKALVIMDFFTGQMITAVDAFKETNIRIVNIQANIRNCY